MITTIRNATLEDAGWIASICHQQFQVAHKGGILPEDLIYYVDKTFHIAAVEDDIRIADNRYLLAVSPGGQPLGCVKMGPVNLPQAAHLDDALEITRFYVLPEMIGTHVAKALMEGIFDNAATMQITSLWLHVYKKNHRAIRFYEKAGFVIVGEQDFPVRNSCPVGWVMKKSLHK